MDTPFSTKHLQNTNNLPLLGAKVEQNQFIACDPVHVLEFRLLVVLTAIDRLLLDGERPSQGDVDFLTEVCRRINATLACLTGTGGDHR